MVDKLLKQSMGEISIYSSVILDMKEFNHFTSD